MSSKGAKFYGYAVLIVAVITFLISVSSFVSAIFDLSDPMHAKSFMYRGGPSLASFETYKMDIMKSVRGADDEAEAAYIPDDETLRGMYEAAKNDRISKVTLEGRRSITVSAIMIFVSIGLFVFHWIWLRRLTRDQ